MSKLGSIITPALPVATVLIVVAKSHLRFGGCCGSFMWRSLTPGPTPRSGLSAWYCALVVHTGTLLPLHPARAYKSTAERM
jgi:hypothetical protein